MKVSVVRGGGLAGLVQTTTADSETLAPDDADRLRRTVDEAGFFDLPGDAPPSGRGPDRFHYAVTVEDDNRTHTVRRAEPDLPQELSALIDLVTSVPGRRDHLAPPGEPPGP